MISSWNATDVFIYSFFFIYIYVILIKVTVGPVPIEKPVICRVYKILKYFCILYYLIYFNLAAFAI